MCNGAFQIEQDIFSHKNSLRYLESAVSELTPVETRCSSTNTSTSRCVKPMSCLNTHQPYYSPSEPSLQTLVSHSVLCESPTVRSLHILPFESPYVGGDKLPNAQQDLEGSSIHVFEKRHDMNQYNPTLLRWLPSDNSFNTFSSGNHRKITDSSMQSVFHLGDLGSTDIRPYIPLAPVIPILDIATAARAEENLAYTDSYFTQRECKAPTGTNNSRHAQDAIVAQAADSLCTVMNKVSPKLLESNNLVLERNNNSSTIRLTDDAGRTASYREEFDMLTAPNQNDSIAEKVSVAQKQPRNRRRLATIITNHEFTESSNSRQQDPYKSDIVSEPKGYGSRSMVVDPLKELQKKLLISRDRFHSPWSGARSRSEANRQKMHDHRRHQKKVTSPLNQSLLSRQMLRRGTRYNTILGLSSTGLSHSHPTHRGFNPEVRLRKTSESFNSDKRSEELHVLNSPPSLSPAPAYPQAVPILMQLQNRLGKLETDLDASFNIASILDQHKARGDKRRANYTAVGLEPHVLEGLTKSGLLQHQSRRHHVPSMDSCSTRNSRICTKGNNASSPRTHDLDVEDPNTDITNRPQGIIHSGLDKVNVIKEKEALWENRHHELQLGNSSSSSFTSPRMCSEDGKKTTGLHFRGRKFLPRGSSGPLLHWLRKR